MAPVPGSGMSHTPFSDVSSVRPFARANRVLPCANELGPLVINAPLLTDHAPAKSVPTTMRAPVPVSMPYTIEREAAFITASGVSTHPPRGSMSPARS